MKRLALTLLLFFLVAPQNSSAETTLARGHNYRKKHHHRHNKKSEHTHPNKQYRVVIDAGHGGEDFGTYSRSTPRQHEKYLTLTTAYMTRDYLKKMGYDVLMTRLKDETVSLQERVDFAERQNANLFVSLHYNSAPSDKAQGIEVFYFKNQKEPSRSQLSNKLAETTLSQLIGATQAKSRGVKHGNFKVIRETVMPAILIEGGFLTNEEELEKLKRPSYLDRLAQSVASAVDQYIHSK